MPLGTTHELTDLTIIGAGPTGLFALFYAGMRGATARVLDALPELGGQLAALYPEKDIFDVAGFPKILAKDLIRSLAEQAARFHPHTSPYFLNQRVHALEEDGGHFTLVTETDRFRSRAIVIAAGIGAFTPRRLPQPFAEQWYGKGIYDVVTNPDEFHGKRVVILGGGDSAFDWATQLLGKASSVTLVHRTDRFRAHGATVRQLQSAVQEGRAALHTFHDLAGISGNSHLTSVTLRDSKAKDKANATREIPADAVLAMLGYHSDIGPLAEWGMHLENHEIVVSSTMETGRPGIYAAGDITTYPGKLKLIATGFSEAAIAVNQAVHWIYPDKKVAPGHSSNMAIFGQTDD